MASRSEQESEESLMLALELALAVNSILAHLQDTNSPQYQEYFQAATPQPIPPNDELVARDKMLLERAGREMPQVFVNTVLKFPRVFEVYEERVKEITGIPKDFVLGEDLPPLF